MKITGKLETVLNFPASTMPCRQHGNSIIAIRGLCDNFCCFWHVQSPCHRHGNNLNATTAKLSLHSPLILAAGLSPQVQTQPSFRTRVVGCWWHVKVRLSRLGAALGRRIIDAVGGQGSGGVRGRFSACRPSWGAKGMYVMVINIGVFIVR